jgi:hypothetical protein
MARWEAGSRERLQAAASELFSEQGFDAATVAAIAVVALAVAGFGADLVIPRRYPRQREAVIAASPDLTERELIKYESLTAACAEALQRRGVDEPTAQLASRAGITVFRAAYGAWIEASDEVTMAEIVPEVLDSFRHAVAVSSVGR